MQIFKSWRLPERVGIATAVLCLLFSFGGDAPASPLASDTTRDPSSVFDQESGRLLQRFLDSNAYGASRQNWDAVQDSSGRLFVANTNGILVYDGHEWRTLSMEKGSPAVSMAADEQGRVFVGGKETFGQVRRDSLGRLRYVSLSSSLPDARRPIGEIVRTEVTDDHVYFQSAKCLFRWTPETSQIRGWALSGSEFQHASVVRDTLFVNVSGKGLMSVAGNALQLVPGGGELADRSVRFLLPHREQGLLVGTFRGLLLREEDSFRSFDTEVDSLIRDAWLYAGTRLHDGTIAIGTVDHGLLLLAPDGTIRRHLEARGHPVTGLFEDREGGLWALLDGGMIRYSVGAPFTKFGSKLGLKGIVADLTRHNDTLYAATNEETYRLKVPPGSTASFHPIPAFRREMAETPSWAFQSMGSDLLVGTLHGLARRQPDGTVDYLFRGQQVFDLLRSQRDSSRVYAAAEGGIRVFSRTSGDWTEVRSPIELSADPRMMTEENDGTLWVGLAPTGLRRIRGLASGDSVSVDRFGPDHGLPGGAIKPYRWQGEIVFGTEKEILRFTSSSSPTFSPYSLIEVPFPGGKSQAQPHADRRGRAWGPSGAGPGRWVQIDSTWRWRPGPLFRLRGQSARTVHVDEGGRTVWFGLWKGEIVRHTPDSGWPRSTPSTLIHRVYAHGSDSLQAARGTWAGTTARPRIRNGIRITYGTPSLAKPDNVLYQYKMEGEDAEWSDWTPQTEQIYRSLGPGPHTFAVRARTAYGDTTQTARYSFTVLPPWYRTWGAYALYALLAGGLVAGVVQLRTRQLRQRQEELEAAVEARTEEIETQKEQLADQAERLQELDEAKTQFFANVSHEFRTPLTLILGPVQDLREWARRSPSDDADEQLSIIERNAQRLLRLVDQLLGIARMNAGTYQLDARATDLPTEVGRIARSYEPLAERGSLSLEVNTTPQATTAPSTSPVYVDHEALEHIVGNLLSNAIKYTPAGGTISVTVDEQPEAVTVAVTDTGPGIPDDQQEAVFDRFEQAPDAGDNGSRPQEGAGIGLAFVRDLVDLHGGRIELESAEGEGTRIAVHFVRGPTHLADAHLADASPPIDDANPPGRLPGGERAALPTEALPAAPPPGSNGTNGTPMSENESAADPDTDRPKRVLVVEDNEDVQRYVHSILTPDFEVLTAPNGAEGLAGAREERPDVILADVMMPEMGGDEMTRRLKDDPETAHIPIIMVTARAGTGDEIEGLQLGADDYITKPFDANVLRQRVGGVIAFQERLRKRLQSQPLADPPPEPDDSGEPSEFECRARAVIREHVPDSDFDVEALAKEMAMSRSTLYRTFKEETDTTPSALITEIRLERAKTLLRDGEGSVTQVAYAVGFDQLSSFSRSFREYTGHSPSSLLPTD